MLTTSNRAPYFDASRQARRRREKDEAKRDPIVARIRGAVEERRAESMAASQAYWNFWNAMAALRSPT